MRLLTKSNPKTLKGEKVGWTTYLLHMAPHVQGGKNICPHASPGCASQCLYFAGRGVMNMVQRARIRKTKWFWEDRAGFIQALCKDLALLQRCSFKRGCPVAVRLNALSDIRWEDILVPWRGKVQNVFKHFPELMFYDYTKWPDRKTWPEKNYHLTFSRSENNEVQCLIKLEKFMNVAVVFRNGLPARFWGTRVLDGDKDDLRFLDPPGVVIGLRAKGRARKDTTGFVI